MLGKDISDYQILTIISYATGNSFKHTKHSSHHALTMETVSELSANIQRTDMPIFIPEILILTSAMLDDYNGT